MTPSSKLTINGATLSFDEYGVGEKALVFIHNAGGNRAFTKKQAAYFAPFFHILNVDLRGHGDSTGSPQDYTVESFAKDILDLCEACGIKEATLIGLNYGATIALEIASTHASFVSSLILMDPPIVMEPWVETLIVDHIEELTAGRNENFAENLVEAVFHGAEEIDKITAIKAFNTVSNHTLASVYENLIAWDKDSKNILKKCKMPMLHIQSQNPFCTEESLKQFCPQIMTSKVVGAGHWMTLEASSQVNAMIERFLEISTNAEK